MEKTFTLLEENDDVLLLDPDTFTVRRLKELLEKEMDTKLKNTINRDGNRVFDTSTCILSINSEVKLLLNDIKWCNFPIDCQLLRVGSQGWQKGKLRIQVGSKILSPKNLNEIDICMEFCPDESTPPEPS